MKKSKRNALLLVVVIMTLLFGSIFLVVVAFQDIPKYNSPFLFTLIIGAIGAILGYFTWIQVKPIIFKYSIKKHDDGSMSSFVIMTVIGFSLFIVNEINISSAYKIKCNSYEILNKYREESGYRRPEVNTLVINHVGNMETVVCDYNLWLEKRVGDKINLCFYKSLLGFNY
jgi:hypothetical protein